MCYTVVRYFVANNTFQRYVIIENIWFSQGKAVTCVRLGKHFIHHTILVILPSIYQHLLKLVESSDRNKNAQFFLRHGVHVLSKLHKVPQ